MTLGSPTDIADVDTQRRPPLRLVGALSLWGLLYAGYRAYYALGGTAGMIGTPVSEADFRALNAFGAAVILVAGLLPWLALRAAWFRRVTPALGWVVAVGCGMHALVDWTLRMLSLTGVHPTQLPADVWVSYDRRVADLQDVLMNEPWFFVEGLLWAALALTLASPRGRRLWVVSALVAVATLTTLGVLSGLGVIGSFTVG